MKRFVAAALALIMVLALIPVGALSASAATVTYTIDFTTLTAAADKEAIADGTQLGTDNYYVVSGTVQKRTNSDGSVKAVELAKNGGGAVSFTVLGTADTVTIMASSTGSSNNSDLSLEDANGNLVANDNGETVAVVTGTSFTAVTFTNLPAGTYSVQSKGGSNGRGTRVLSIEVSETSDHTHSYEAVVTAPGCETAGYTTYTCECGHSYQDDFTEATGHTYVDGICSACGRDETAVDTTYTFAASSLTVGTDKALLANGTKVGTSNYFTLNREVTERSKSSGVYAVELGKKASGSVSFTVLGVADVTVMAASTGGSNTSQIALVNAAGETVGTVGEVTGTGNVAFTWEGLTAGTYYVVNPSSERNTRVASVEVVETTNAATVVPVAPESIEMTWNDVALAAGTTSVTYSYIAEGTGTATMYLSDAPEGADILVTNKATGESYTLSADGVDNWGLELQLPVVGGDELIITVVVPANEAGLEFTLIGSFAYPVGSEQNPVNFFGETYQYVIPAETTVYFQTYADGMTLAVTGVDSEGAAGVYSLINGTETIAAVDGAASTVLYTSPLLRGACVFAISNTSKLDITADMVLTYPLGHYQNPEVITSLDEITTDLVEGDSDGYYYEYTVTEAGVLTLSLTSLTEGVEGDIMIANQNSYENVSLSEDGSNGSVSAIVNEGDVLKIQVVTVVDENYNNPAGTLKVTSSTAAVEKFSLMGANVVLGSDLTMNFAVLGSNLINNNYYAKIVMYNPDGTTTEVDKYFYTWQDMGAYKLIVLDGLVAKQMADKVEVTIYSMSHVQVSNTWTDSIRDYAVRQLTSPANAGKTELFTVIVDMLNFGAAAQNQFNYNKADLANSTLTDAQKAYATASLNWADYENNQVKGAGYMGTTLALENKIVLGIFFNEIAEIESDGLKAVVSYTDHSGNEVSYEVEEWDFNTDLTGFYGIMVDTLVAADVFTVVNVEIYDGETLVASCADSIESYLVRQSATLGDIYVALMKYVVAAYNYNH